MSKQVTFKSGVEVAAEHWKRSGKVEWPAMLTLKLRRRDVLRLNREFALWLEHDQGDEFETALPGEVTVEGERR